MALEGSKIPYNPQAAALAKKYVAEIKKQCGWHSAPAGEDCSQNIGGLPESYKHLAPMLEHHFQEKPQEWELDEHDLAALEKLPF